MNFDWTETEQKLRDDVGALFDEETRTRLDALETAGVEEIRSTVIAQLERLAETGYLGVGIAGDGVRDTLRLVGAQEVLAESSGALLLAVEASARLFGGLVARHGADGLREALLSKIQAGALIGAVAASDGASEDAANAGVQAARADGGVKLSGRKAFVTNGPFADWIAVFADLDGTPVVGVVPGDAKGLTRGDRVDTLGFKGLAVCAIELDGVAVDEAHLLGPFEDRAALEALRRTEDLVLTVASVGLMHRSLEAAKAHAHAHQRGGKPLMGYQEIRFKLAEMLTLHQTAQLYAYRAGWLVSDVDGPDAFEAAAVVRSAKVFAAEAAEQVATAAMQILAGQGFVSGNPVERSYRDAKYPGLAGTTTEVCRMLIADELLERNPV